MESKGQQEMLERCRREVIELHRFFEEWFNGDLEPTAEAFGRFSEVMAPRFELIQPSGERRDLDSLLNSLQAGHGKHRRDDSRMRIQIRDVRCQPLSGGLARVTYEEWQEIGGESRGRISTALFRRTEASPNGVEWLSVHETWLPDLHGSSRRGRRRD